MQRSIGKPRGILRSKAHPGIFDHSRHAPAEDTGYFIEHYWVVSWDLRHHEPYLAETLPHPSVYITIEKGRSGLGGVKKGKFSRWLENKGRVFGIKFRPGGFYPFIQSSVTKFTDRIVPIHSIFGESALQFEKNILETDEKNSLIELADSFIRTRLPKVDDNVELINRITNVIMYDRTILKVDDVSDRFCLSKRTLQRLFNLYVGVTPKWVIQRYRLHEAIEQLAENVRVDWTKFALDLGYFDQAHFIKDFKNLIGCTPEEYVADRKIHN
ncbi:helix-turn-helix domain-containing protein [bacterium]|nr:helix-turn-helix domain-containing protein [bacterium]